MKCGPGFGQMGHRIGMHGCCCEHGHHGHFLSKKKRIEMLKKKADSLKEKIEDIEEFIKELEGK